MRSNAMKKPPKTISKAYSAWIADLKKRWRATQIKAAVAVNSALIEFYWNLGRDIAEDFAAEARYGSRFFEKVSRDMLAEFPGDSGFSTRNVRYCLSFYRLYASPRILQQAVAESSSPRRKNAILPQVVAKSDRSGCVTEKLPQVVAKSPQSDSGETSLPQLVEQLICVPWGHHRTIIDKCKGDRDKALFYVRRTIQNGWSRSVLLNWLSTDLYESEGRAQTNFALTLPSADAEAQLAAARVRSTGKTTKGLKS